MFSIFDRMTGFSGLTGFFNRAIKAANLNHIRAFTYPYQAKMRKKNFVVRWIFWIFKL